MSAGTESPPLEATGEHRPIGAASKAGEPLNEGVKDSVQRGGYLGDNKSTGDSVPDSGSGVSAGAIAGAEKSGQDVENKGTRS